MNELISQNNLPSKQHEDEGYYYEYTIPNLLDSIKKTVENLPDDPEQLIQIRNNLEKYDDIVAYQLGGTIDTETMRVVNRLSDQQKREKAKELKHALLDIMHAINRKLNKIGYEEN